MEDREGRGQEMVQEEKKKQGRERWKLRYRGPGGEPVQRWHSSEKESLSLDF